MTAVDYANQTILITGASSGIGAEFARQLAARASNLVLVARRLDRLDALAAELRAGHSVTVTTVALDLAEPRAGETLAAELGTRGIALTGLINNAGFGTFGQFHDAGAEELRREIAVDVASLVDISHAFIDQLRTAGRGILVNVASIAAYQPIPTMAVYGAAKAFVLSFTEALWYESRSTGLRVLSLAPGATQTEFFEVAGEAAGGGVKRATPSEVVTVALRALDRGTQPSVIYGGGNRVLSVVSRLFSRRRIAIFAGQMNERSTARF
jgi:short-subunit dehydrogenase